MNVTIPKGAIDTAGLLTIRSLAGSQEQRGWSIELAGATLTGEATIRFVDVRKDTSEPPPLVTYESGAGATHEIATGVTVEDGFIAVRTTHFSNWFTFSWDALLQDAKAWLAQELDKAASVSPDRAPTCAGEKEARVDGISVTSDSGRRVYWCLGKESGKVVLKAVNARSYGVAVESTPGLARTYADADDLLGIIAKLVPPSPSMKGNKVQLLASGNRLEFAVGSNPSRMGVKLGPDPGGYLLSALHFGIGTYTMVMGRVGSSDAQTKLLGALQGQQCLSTFTSLATTSLDTPEKAQDFFRTALGLALDCIAVSIETIDVGLINQTMVAPLIWLMNGLKTAADGVVGALDTGFDTDGYQIVVTRTARNTAMSNASARAMLIPAGSCGDGKGKGWDQRSPIQLRDGQGEAFIGDTGASILDAGLVGSVDVNRDGVKEAVLWIICAGSRISMCCAGRASMMDVVVVLDLSGAPPRRVGQTIWPTDARDASGTVESRYLDGKTARIEGQSIITHQTPIYRDILTPAETALLVGDVRYTLQNGRWVPAS